MATTSKTKLQNFIDGEFVDSADGATEEVTNPANGEVIAEQPLSGEEDVNRAVAAAKAPSTAGPPPRPASAPTRCSSSPTSLEEHAEELSDLEAADAGKPRNAFLEDEMPVRERQPALLRAAPGACSRARPRASTWPGRTSIIRREPVGVVGQIAPWNYPLMMAVWKIGPALAAGNTIVLKPAETTPISTVKLAELAARGPAEGRAQRDHGPRQAGRLVARDAPRRGHGLADRLAGDRQVDRRGRGRLAQARAPRARRQGAGDRVRRRGHGDRDGDDRGHRRSTTRARTAPPPRACSPRRRSTTTW